MKTLRLFVMYLAVLLLANSAYASSDCLSDIYNSVESGKKFHPLWPFISGTSTVGTVVIAKDPKKVQAYFGSIDSPDYRPPGATPFPVKSLQFTTPTTCSSGSNIGADVAFAQLDALSQNLSQGAKTASLAGTQNDATSPKPKVSPTPPSAAQPQGSPTPTTADEGQPANSGSSNANNPSANDPVKAVTNDTYRPSTGVDFSHIKSVTLKITGLSVQYYDLPALTALNSGAALNPYGAKVLAKENNAWIISRALTAGTVEYTLTSDTDVHASFLAQLVSWLPGVKFKYANARTITLTTTAPVTIGYKLWGQGTNFTGAAANPCAQHGCEIGTEEINKNLFPQMQ